MNQLQPVVSVIVPVYNAGAFLRRTLDCICGQTLQEIEIILVDDGSTDASLSIQQEYAARDSRIILLQQEHEYAGAARNKGMAIARGKYLSFLDADDIFVPTMLAQMVKRAEEESADVVVCRCDIFHTEGEYQPLTWQIHDRYLTKINRRNFSLKDKYPQAVFQTFIGWAWDKLFLAEFVKGNGFSFGSTRHGNDAPFVFPAIAAASNISIIDESLVKYRKSEGQISAAGNVARNVTACFTCMETLRAELRRLSVGDGVWQSFHIWCTHYINWNLNKLPQPAREELREQLLSTFEPEMKLLSKLEQLPPSEILSVYEREISLYRLLLTAPEQWLHALEPKKRSSFPLSLFYKHTPTKTSFRFLGIPFWSLTSKGGCTTYRLLGIRLFTRKNNV